MASRNCLILHRKSANEPAVKEAVKYVRGKGIHLRVRIPWNKKDKPAVVSEALAAGATRIIAGGGDGTINAVVNSLVGTGKTKPKVTLGVLPLGTANDFAHGLDLPVDDLSRCLEIACTAKGKRTDVGRANDRCFINVTSGGLGSEITATTPVAMKKALGGAAYTLMGLIKVFKLKPYAARLRVPGKKKPIEGNMLLMAVGNNRLAGGGFEVAPKAKLDDGLLDLAVVSKGEGSIDRLRSELEMPENPENEFVHYWQLPEFTIETDEDVHFNLDGEPTLQNRIRFAVLPKHLRVAY